MKYSASLLVVRDMQKAKHFYEDVLGLEVVADFGANVTLTGGIALQSLESWLEFIDKAERDLHFQNNVCELYFEEDDIESFAARLSQRDDIEYVHPLKEHAWGQRVVRFYDPDSHIIEVGETLTAVIKRFLQSGLSIEETAQRMDIPVSFVRSSLAQAKHEL
jgi:catechol 2,3-dioxygenase-like lactoylglutathione lyase family enzyme